MISSNHNIFTSTLHFFYFSGVLRVKTFKEVFKMKKWIMFASLALAVVIGTASLTYAKGGPGTSNRKTVGWATVLELTDAQIAKIQTTLKSSNQEATAKMQAMQQTMGSLRELEWSKDYSDEKAQALIDQMQKTREEMQAVRQSSQDSIYNELTDAQKVKYMENCRGGRNCDGNPPP
jgi:Spy/CpxP family protein refolding chaperone